MISKGLKLSESSKGILSYYGSGVWTGDLKAMRRSRRFISSRVMGSPSRRSKTTARSLRSSKKA